MKLYAPFLITLALLSFNASVPAQARTASDAVTPRPVAVTRVVIQVSDKDPQKWNLAINNAQNIQQALGAEHTAIEIVAYGPGIGMLKKDSPVASRITDASLSGIQFKACQNTMQGLKLTKTDMLEEADYVPAGVVEIIRRQQQGYAYIRP